MTKYLVLWIVIIRRKWAWPNTELQKNPLASLTVFLSLSFPWHAGFWITTLQLEIRIPILEAFTFKHGPWGSLGGGWVRNPGDLGIHERGFSGLRNEGSKNRDAQNLSEQRMVELVWVTKVSLSYILMTFKSMNLWARSWDPVFWF